MGFPFIVLTLILLALISLISPTPFTLKNLFKTKTAKRRDAKKDFDNKKLPLWKRIIALFKIAFTAVGKDN